MLIQSNPPAPLLAGPPELLEGWSVRPFPGQGPAYGSVAANKLHIFVAEATFELDGYVEDLLKRPEKLFSKTSNEIRILADLTLK